MTQPQICIPSEPLVIRQIFPLKAKDDYYPTSFTRKRMWLSASEVQSGTQMCRLISLEPSIISVLSYSSVSHKGLWCTRNRVYFRISVE